MRLLELSKCSVPLPRFGYSHIAQAYFINMAIFFLHLRIAVSSLALEAFYSPSAY